MTEIMKSSFICKTKLGYKRRRTKRLIDEKMEEWLELTESRNG